MALTQYERALNDRLTTIRSRVESAKRGYALHVGCLGEVVWSDVECRDYCHFCRKSIPREEICYPPSGDSYEVDVEFLLDLLKQSNGVESKL